MVDLYEYVGSVLNPMAVIAVGSDRGRLGIV